MRVGSAGFGGQQQMTLRHAPVVSDMFFALKEQRKAHPYNDVHVICISVIDRACLSRGMSEGEEYDDSLHHTPLLGRTKSLGKIKLCEELLLSGRREHAPALKCLHSRLTTIHLLVSLL